MGFPGRKQAGSRCYFECGPVLDVSSVCQPYPRPKALYFTVNNLEEVYVFTRTALGSKEAEWPAFKARTAAMVATSSRR